jgi:hypothetical protein
MPEGMSAGGSAELGEHLVESKLTSMSSVEKVEVLRQVLAADVIDLRMLGRCARARTDRWSSHL